YASRSRGPVGFVSFLARARTRLDPRRSVAARLLFVLFLAFLIPGAVLVLLLEQRVAELREGSLERFVGARRAQASRQLQQDANFRAEWIDRRAALVEEAGWSLAQAVKDDLTGALDGSHLRAPRDADGHIWSGTPESDSVGYISAAHA